MCEDSIVQEVRAIREEYARQFDYDIHAICENLRVDAADSGRRVVRLRAKRVRVDRNPDDKVVRV